MINGRYYRYAFFTMHTEATECPDPVFGFLVHNTLNTEADPDDQLFTWIFWCNFFSFSARKWSFQIPKINQRYITDIISD